MGILKGAAKAARRAKIAKKLRQKVSKDIEEGKFALQDINDPKVRKAWEAWEKAYGKNPKKETAKSIGVGVATGGLGGLAAYLAERNKKK